MTPRRMALLAGAVAAILAPSQLVAQSRQVVDLEPSGQTVSLATGGRSVHLYRFPALAGTRILVSISRGAGRVTVRLYTPGGDEMLLAVGTDTVNLDATLSLDGTHYVSVVRADSSEGREMAFRVIEPRPFASLFAMGVGYEMVDERTGTVAQTMCWIDPGMAIRIRPGPEGGFVKRETFRDPAIGVGLWRQEWYMDDGTRVTTRVEVRVEGDEEIATVSYQGRVLRTNRSPVGSPVGEGMRLGRYVGYYCR